MPPNIIAPPRNINRGNRSCPKKPSGILERRRNQRKRRVVARPS
ncbi:10273_t:CDS:2 [Funneliformis geosporum]|nr:10273_t:CDS:2 [Funneliformis geosporum]